MIVKYDTDDAAAIIIEIINDNESTREQVEKQLSDLKDSISNCDFWGQTMFQEMCEELSKMINAFSDKVQKLCKTAVEEMAGYEMTGYIACHLSEDSAFVEGNHTKRDDVKPN